MMRQGPMWHGARRVVWQDYGDMVREEPTGKGRGQARRDEPGMVAWPKEGAACGST